MNFNKSVPKSRCFILSLFTILTLNNCYAQDHISVRVIEQTNFDAQLQSVLDEAVLIIDSVVNNDAFKTKVLSSHFLGTNGKSNQEIWNLFSRGVEIHSPEPNNAMDLKLSIYPGQNGDNIGTTMGGEKIVSSRAYILRNGSKCYASHIIHEYFHTLGFVHRHRVFTKKQRREKCLSVPYVVGDVARIIMDCGSCGFECENFGL